MIDNQTKVDCRLCRECPLDDGDCYWEEDKCSMGYTREKVISGQWVVVSGYRGE